MSSSTPAVALPLTSSVSGIVLAEDAHSSGKQKLTRIFSEVSKAYFCKRGFVL